MNIQRMSNGKPIRRNSTYRRTRNSKKRYLKIKAMFFFLISIVTLILIGLSPLFNITYFEVNGCQHYDKSQIIDATDIVFGINGFKSVGSNLSDLFTLRYHNSEKLILNKFAYIRSVKVKFFLPNIVNIDIEERKPLCVVDYFGTKLVLDKEVYVLETLKAGTKVSLPLIKGIKFDNFKMGQALKIYNYESYNYAIKVINAIIDLDKSNSTVSDKSNSVILKKGLMKLVNQVNVQDSSNVWILVDARLKVKLGNLKELNDRLTFFREIITKKLKKQDKGSLDMTLIQPVFTPD